MPVFIVVSQNPQPELRAAIERLHAGNFYHWKDRVSFVVAPNTARALAELMGVKSGSPDGTLSGTIDDTIVSQLGPSYWGFADKDLWVWLQAAHERDVL